jgi:hypothetical protein
MQFSFDLISDLHVDQWQGFDWTDQATSPVCVVAGNIARGHKATIDVLRHLTQCYQAVFYIDGSTEHDQYRNNLLYSYQQLTSRLSNIPRLVYLQDNVIVLNGVALLATNGWWQFDFDSGQSPIDAEHWFSENTGADDVMIDQIRNMSEFDTQYMINGIRRLQTHTDVKRIVIVTHTVPDPALIDHDLAVAGSPEFMCMGNKTMMQAMAADTESKISTWCFGRYHGSVDQIRSGIRFVNNPRGGPNDPYPQLTYFPRRITVEI